MFNKKNIVAVVIAILALFGVNIVSDKVSSVQQSNEYHATTTSTGRFTQTSTIQTGSGALGSVVITGAAAGVMNFYDATTTDPTKRDPSQASSTILVASFPASTAAGTYTFDQVLYRGLTVDIIGTMPTSTITYR